MTRKEFYLKSIIAMAGNPNFVEVKPSDDDEKFISHVLLTEEIVMDAERLMSAVGTEWPSVFDDDTFEEKESIKTTLQKISESISGPFNCIVEEA